MWRQRFSPPSSEWPAKASGDSLVRSAIWVLQRSIWDGMAPGAIPGQIDRWSTQIAERTKLSPLAFAGHSELGGLNRWRHIWAYKDANHRAEVREHARKEGIWPPRGGQPGQTLVQENMLVIPAAFSPLR